ncbi:MAG: thioredoxin domain-containing protein [[Clostridium] cellulosi]
MANMKVPNRLSREKSPYLLQHQYNPVNWYPWCEEAFEKAKAEDKPVFLSIGYSTCHWCHVMERESFEDEEVADILNSNFVSIKVDREERPDIDNFYMDACVALNGSGGWPLSCFLTPDKKPFMVGTYFPKNDGRYGTGFITILKYISDIWKSKRKDILEDSETIAAHISSQPKKSKLNENCSSIAYGQLSGSFDPEYGGFGHAPKFPTLHNILFLLRYGLINDDSNAFDYVKKTLDSMRAGGIFDHVGGGFCRYSTDNKWLVPHFEKMMYDNALHIMAYSEAGALIDKKYFDTVREVVDFCVRDMLHPDGGFYTAIDADSEGVEGKYYVFTPKEISKVLGDKDGERYCRLYNITRQGNFEGKNIPNLIGVSLSDDDKRFAVDANKMLLNYRQQRIPPATDDKIMTSINGLMSAALAEAGRIMGESKYLDYASRSTSFICNNLIKDGRLLSYWRDGAADIPATSDDYAYFIWGLIELYEAEHYSGWLALALKYTDDMNRLFWDDENGGYFMTGKDVSDMPFRQKNLHDGAIPCGNSVAAFNLARLSRICAKPEYERRAEAVLEAMAKEINAYPSSCCGALCADLFFKARGREIVFVNGQGLDELLSCLPSFSPFTVTAVCGKGYEQMDELAPFLKDYKSENGKAAAYLCSGGTCKQPVSDVDEFKKLLLDSDEV